MTEYPQSIRARVGEGAIAKTTRFYAATLDEILIELLQNARRAGASCIIVTERDETLTIEDDGDGIVDPQALVTFGESAWDGETASLEDAAGMGFWSLSRLGCEIYSHAEGASQGWTATITPDAFIGQAPVEIKPHDLNTRGTAFRFRKPERGQCAKHALDRVCQHYPLPIKYWRVDKDPLKEPTVDAIARRDFLERAVAVHEIASGRIGVFEGIQGSSTPTVNFHGLTIRTETATVRQHFGAPDYEVRFDLTRADEIELVLPARKEIVQTDAWRRLIDEGKTRIYAHIARQGHHCLGFDDYCNARQRGVALPEAVAKLRPWSPETGDPHGWIEARQERGVNDHDVVFTMDATALEQQLLAEAVARTDLEAKLLEPVGGYEGYQWYDRLTRLTSVSFVIEKNGSTLRFTELEELIGSFEDEAPTPLSAGLSEDYADPEAIYAEIILEDKDGAKTKRQLPMDFLLVGEGYSPEEITVFVDPHAKAKTRIDPELLTGVMVRGYFCYSDDSDADAYNTQYRNFEIAARAAACEALLSKEDADKTFIEDHVREHVQWRCPTNARTVISIARNNITVRFGGSAQLEDAAVDMYDALQQLMPFVEDYLATHEPRAAGHIAYAAAKAALEKAGARGGEAEAAQ